MANKYILCGVSLLVGGIAGYFIGHKVAINKSQKIADEQVEDVKASLKELYEDRIKEAREKKEIEKTNEESEELGVDPGINDIDSRTRFQRSSEAVQPDDKQRNQINGDESYIKPVKKEKNANRSEVIKRPKDLPPTSIDTPDGYPDPENIAAPPYLIRERDFGDLDNFDSIELILWADSRVSVNDSYCELVSPTKLFELLPENWVNMFDWDHTGKYASIIYFRNNKEKVDIEITKDLRTYKEWLEEVYPGRADEIE